MMGPETKVYRTEQLIKEGLLAIGDGYRAKNSELAASGLPFARAGNIDGGFKFADADCFPEANIRVVGEKVSREGDVVFTSKGTVGRFAFVRAETPRFVFSPQLCYWRSLDHQSIHPRFLYYWMHGEEFWEQADAVKGQTDMADYVSLTDQRRMFITLPPLDQQCAIAEVLGALDDKIDLNRQMNHTLEEMASALFKSWFVDFDPVIAKADGRKPFGMDAATAALFPSDLSDLIPRGWRMASVYDIADVVYGAPFASARFNTSGVGLPLLRIRDLADHAPGAYTDENHPRGTKVKPGDIVVGMDGEFRAHVWRGPVSWLNQRVCMFVPKSDAGRVFNLLSIRPLLAEYEGSAVGTTVIHLGKADIDRFRVVHPTAPVLEAYRRQAEPWFDLVIANAAESRTLTALRDTLLPKLLSGEVRLKQAESLVGCVL